VARPAPRRGSLEKDELLDKEEKKNRKRGRRRNASTIRKAASRSRKKKKRNDERKALKGKTANRKEIHPLSFHQEKGGPDLDLSKGNLRRRKKKREGGCAPAQERRTLFSTREYD